MANDKGSGPSLPSSGLVHLFTRSSCFWASENPSNAGNSTKYSEYLKGRKKYYLNQFQQSGEHLLVPYLRHHISDIIDFQKIIKIVAIFKELAKENQQRLYWNCVFAFSVPSTWYNRASINVNFWINCAYIKCKSTHNSSNFQLSLSFPQSLRMRLFSIQRLILCICFLNSIKYQITPSSPRIQ